MQKTILRTSAAALALALAGCGARVDTSTPQSFAASVEKVEAALSPDDKLRFERAVRVLALATADPDGNFLGKAPVASPLFAAAGDKINGKTGGQIIKAGHEAERDLLIKDIATDAANITQMRAARSQFASVLDNLRISNAAYAAPVNVIGQRDPEIKFTVTNGSKTPIKAIMLHGRLASPGRSVPWVESPVSYEIPGGIEPGETKALDLAPNMFGDWKAQDDFAARKDLILSLTVENATGADGQPFLSNSAMDVRGTADDMAKKQRQLDALKS